MFFSKNYIFAFKKSRLWIAFRTTTGLFPRRISQKTTNDLQIVSRFLQIESVLPPFLPIFAKNNQ